MKFTYDISIIIPCYNCSKFVEETILSLKKQTYDFNKIEILLINDGSQDNTLEVIKKYEDKNIIVIDKKNEGVSATRNLGIQVSRGKYLLFLDPDDYLSEKTIANIIQFFDKHYDEIDLVTYPMILFYPNGRKVMHGRYKNDYDETKVYDLNEYYFLVQATINVCIKNNKDYAFDTKQFYSEDEQFNAKILMDKKKIGFVREAIYYYRQHSASITSHKQDFDFEKVYRFHSALQERYHNHPYIQSIIINNLRWRLNEECLYPNTLTKEEINEYVKNIARRLSKIDFSLFNDFLNNRMLLHLVALSNQKCRVKKNSDNTYSLWCNSKLIVDNIISRQYLYSYELDNKILTLHGRVNTAFFHGNDVKLIAQFTYKKGRHEKKNISLFYDIDYFKNYERDYALKIDLTCVKKISFYLEINDKLKIDLNTYYEEWCSKRKIINKYNLIIKNGIIIKRAKIWNHLRNNLIYSRNIKFLMINFLSWFDFKDKKKILYFGNKNSKLYELYQNDNSKYKVFKTEGKGLKYKLLLLSCKKLVTDQSIRKVIPFGKMRKKYVQVSRFIIIKK